MKLEVEIISRQDIRPSSPTPPELRTFKLSLLDQLIPTPYAPIILFYTDSTTLSESSNRVKLLKKSLSDTLTKFYPLGGKIKDELSIDCNDEGANFIESRVNCPLSEFLINPDLNLLHKFLPSELLDPQAANFGTYVTNVQVNVFECGGIAIGTCISHRILDGAALSTFLNCWSESANKVYDCNNFTKPNFIASSIFPANSLWLRDLSMGMWGSMFKHGKFVTRRFLFTNSAISKLKGEILAKPWDYAGKDPTRLEIVSAVLWKFLMNVSKPEFGVQRHSLVTHLANLRRRMDEDLCPNHSMGNLLWLVSAEHMMMSEDVMELDELVGKLRNAISRIDKGFVEKLQGDEGGSIMQESIRKVCEALSKKNEVEHFGFSSWCNLGFYDADFGWGKPTWVSSVASNGSVFMNLIILVDTRLGDGIEAWVTLDKDHMNHLIENPEFLNHATLDPSPLMKVN